MHVKHRHHSLKFNADESHIEAALREHRAAATVVTGTETGAERWTRLLKAEGWEVRREMGDHAKGGVFVAWNDEVWEPRVGWVQELSDVTYDGRRVHVAIQKLRHRQEGTRVFFMASHMPAHIERAFFKRLRREPRVKAYNESLTTLRALIIRLRTEHPNAHFVVTGDWNLDFRKPWVPIRLGLRLRGSRLKAARVPKGTGGSHGKRLIDWAVTDLVGTGEVLKEMRASDHKPIAMVYEIERDDSPDVD